MSMKHTWGGGGIGGGGVFVGFGNDLVLKTVLAVVFGFMHLIVCQFEYSSTAAGICPGVTKDHTYAARNTWVVIAVGLEFGYTQLTNCF